MIFIELKQLILLTILISFVSSQVTYVKDIYGNAVLDFSKNDRKLIILFALYSFVVLK